MSAVTAAPAHTDYPHEAGRLSGCPACEAACHCQSGCTECVFEGVHAGEADTLVMHPDALALAETLRTATLATNSIGRGHDFQWQTFGYVAAALTEVIRVEALHAGFPDPAATANDMLHTMWESGVTVAEALPYAYRHAHTPCPECGAKGEGYVYGPSEVGLLACESCGTSWIPTA